MSEGAWSNHLPNDEGINNDNDAIKANQELFNDHEPMEDDDDIGNLDDYLIPNDASYYVDEKEKRFKERRSKLLRIPYMNPPTFKSKKFERVAQDSMTGNQEEKLMDSCRSCQAEAIVIFRGGDVQ
ncbi:hypothetical protein Tco_1265995 [Tanacetum coccineum]